MSSDAQLTARYLWTQWTTSDWFAIRVRQEVHCMCV